MKLQLTMNEIETVTTQLEHLGHFDLLDSILANVEIKRTNAIDELFNEFNSLVSQLGENL